MFSRWCLQRLLVLIFLTGVMPGGVSASASSKEYKLKAAYLLNFARFIYWPEEAFEKTDNNFNICVYGESPFGESLNKLADKKIHKKNIKLNYVKKIEGVLGCHIVFICSSEEVVFEELISGFPEANMLTVSDIKGFSANGGMIEFVRVGNKIKFEINLKESARQGIKYRSQLLEVAEHLR